MNCFVVRSLHRWQFRRGGQRPTRRKPFTGPEPHGMRLNELMGTVKYPAKATPGRSSLSRVPENSMLGLKAKSETAGAVLSSSARLSVPANGSHRG